MIIQEKRPGMDVLPMIFMMIHFLIQNGTTESRKCGIGE